MRKVYCNNCRWCKYRELASLGVNWGWFCRLKDRVTINAVGQKIVDLSDSNCLELNIDLDCPCYRRLWYKFWIKPDKSKSKKRMNDNVKALLVALLIGCIIISIPFIVKYLY